MKKHIMIHTNLIICIIIISGFVIMAMSNYHTYGKVIKNDIENISKLTSSNIYSEFDSDLTKPIFVSMTMANDSFLKTWLEEETESGDGLGHYQKIESYLLGIKNKYQYSSVYLISSKTQIYYHYEKIHKKVSTNNAHDVWYYDFIKSQKEFKLNVDQDEADNGSLTVFADSRIEDNDGNLMGVVGVGVKMNQLQEVLDRYQENYNLEAFLVDSSGIIQVHSDEAMIENASMFDHYPLARYETEIFKNKDSQETYWYQEDNQEKYLITQYIPNLGWYLVVEKDTSSLRKSLQSQIWRDSLIIFVIILLLVLLSYSIISYYKKSMTMLVITDELTKLPNRRAFNELLTAHIRIRRENPPDSCIFVFDVDHFKQINDTYGHVFGDFVLIRIGETAKKIMNTEGTVARWGGDEFFGIINADKEKAKQTLDTLVAAVIGLEEFEKYPITISAGYTEIRKDDHFDALLARADQALYTSKENGRNQLTYAP